MKKQQGFVQYFVEGEDEKKLLSVLKTDMQLILPGKINKLNVVQKKLTKPRLMNLRSGTVVVLVFDTDTDNSEILKENICILEKEDSVDSVICVTQVMNLEDELVRSCNIKYARELTSSKTDSEYKKKFIAVSNLAFLLEKNSFNINMIWIKQPSGAFSGIENRAFKIKK